MSVGTSSRPFRFRDLPEEIRNKICRNVLCDFAPAPTTFTLAENLFDQARAEHNVETVILRTSKETHYEGFDVMIKTNRFVKITSEPGLPIKAALNGQRAPMVTVDKDLVYCFKGYVLDMHLGLSGPKLEREDSDPAFSRPLTAMILHRDLDKLCDGINDGDGVTPAFSQALRMSITMAPVLDSMRGSHIHSSLKDFFSAKTQELLCAPLMVKLYGRKPASIKGHFEISVAIAVRRELARDRYSDPAAVLAEFIAAKEGGSRLYQQRNIEGACLQWQDSALDIDKMIQTSSWPKLFSKGGQDFVSQLASLYFLMRLNITHVQIGRWSTSPFPAERLAEANL